MEEAVVICTRNRSQDLKRLLVNLSSQSGMERRLVCIVDASDPAIAAKNEALVREADGLRVQYERFDGQPSSARQRNFGVELLNDEVRVVHFLDDDVTLEAGCLDRLSAVFEDPTVGGAGPEVRVEGKNSRKPTLWRRLFLLDSVTPGRVLTSGASAAAQRLEANDPFETEWLGGCASYRRQTFLEERFDDSLLGYSLDEDIDLSYRVGLKHRLLVLPDAVLRHHESSGSRLSPREYTREFLVHRYWFLEKNIRHPLRKIAFWWSTLGRFLAIGFSSGSMRRERLAGLTAGVRKIWRRDHPLLRKFPSER